MFDINTSLFNFESRYMVSKNLRKFVIAAGYVPRGEEHCVRFPGIINRVPSSVIKTGVADGSAQGGQSL